LEVIQQGGKSLLRLGSSVQFLGYLHGHKPNLFYLHGLVLEWASKQLVQRDTKKNYKPCTENGHFFQCTVDLIEMVLAKSDLSIAKHYDEVLVYPVDKS